MAAATMPQGGNWSSLPTDLLSLVLDRLPWSSRPSFGAACRHWRSAAATAPPFYPAWLTPLLHSAADVGSTSLRFYSPYHHKNFEVASTLAAPGAKFCCAVGRHLTLCRRGEILEADLATGDVRELPPMSCAWFHFVVYDAGEGRMIGVHAVGPPRAAAVRRDGDGNGDWDRDGGWEYAALPYRYETLPLPLMQSSPNTNPVLHGGELYVLYDDGKLAVYDERRHDGNLEFLDRPSKGFGGPQCEDRYLFESDEGELMAVLVGRRGAPVRVVRLDEQEMEWEEVGSLGGRELFTGTLTTLMRKPSVEWMQNKIFLPRLYDWPETVRVDIVDRHGELAFVPTSGGRVDTAAAKDGTRMWSGELGSGEATEFWGTEKVDYSIWVDFNTGN